MREDIQNEDEEIDYIIKIMRKNFKEKKIVITYHIFKY